MDFESCDDEPYQPSKKRKREEKTKVQLPCSSSPSSPSSQPAPITPKNPDPVKKETCFHLKSKQQELIQFIENRRSKPKTPPFLCFITGPSGCGKTWLVRHVADKVAPAQLVWLDVLSEDLNSDFLIQMLTSGSRQRVLLLDAAEGFTLDFFRLLGKTIATLCGLNQRSKSAKRKPRFQLFFPPFIITCPNRYVSPLSILTRAVKYYHEISLPAFTSRQLFLLLKEAEPQATVPAPTIRKFIQDHSTADANYLLNQWRLRLILPQHDTGRHVTDFRNRSIFEQAKIILDPPTNAETEAENFAAYWGRCCDDSLWTTRLLPVLWNSYPYNTTLSRKLNARNLKNYGVEILHSPCQEASGLADAWSEWNLLEQQTSMADEVLKISLASNFFHVFNRPSTAKIEAKNKPEWQGLKRPEALGQALIDSREAEIMHYLASMEKEYQRQKLQVNSALTIPPRHQLINRLARLDTDPDVKNVELKKKLIKIFGHHFKT